MLGACLTQTGNLEQAEEYLNTARDFYRQMEMRPFLVRTLFTLAQLYAQQNRSDNAHSAQAEAEALMSTLTREGM